MRAFLITLALAGCATGYQQKRSGDGYSEISLGNGSYTVDFHGNGWTDLSDAVAYAHRRAGELCPGGYDVIDSHTNVGNYEKPDAVLTIRCK